ncbi:MAG: hypothetical protein ACI9LO_001748 [Planctomycetota bacterium]|jgi:hypothetical protein
MTVLGISVADRHFSFLDPSLSKRLPWLYAY